MDEASDPSQPSDDSPRGRRSPRQPPKDSKLDPPAAKAQKGRQPQMQPKQKGKPDDSVAEEFRPSIIASLFSHIPVVHRLSSAELLEGTKRRGDRPIIHPALLEFALQAAQDLSLDEDERTRIFLRMMINQIRDEPVDERERFAVSINSLIKRTMNFLYASNRRLTPVGIGNAIRFLKAQNNQAEAGPMQAEERRTRLISALCQFIEEKIDEIVEFIERTVSEAIVEGDVILTYGWSPTICNAFLKAHERGVRFRVIVVDSRPNFDAKRLVEKISELDVRYVLITGLSYVMPEVKKVLIEPCGILSNNAAQTPVGTAMISMVAHESGVPVMFACPSYRFVSKVSIDAVSRNEILAPEYRKPVPRADLEEDPNYLALTYDVTPGQYVDIVMCELGNIPVNSISTNIKFIQDSYTLFTRQAPGKVASKPLPRVPPKPSPKSK